jgi:PAS domain S-box-containing protein
MTGKNNQLHLGKFEDLFESAPDATLLVASDGRIERVNAQAERQFGYRRDELLGKPVELLVPQRFRSDHINHRREFEDKPRVRSMGSSIELYARRKDGTEFPIDVNLSPMKTPDRSFVVAAVRDVTESRRAARELATANEQLRSEKHFSDNLISTQQGIVLVLDPEGRITLVNPYFEELTGYAADQVIGLDWFTTFIPPDEQKTIRDFFAVVMREGINRGYSNTIVTKYGDHRLIQWHSKTVEGTDDRIVGLLNTGYDVTEQEAAARALRAAKDEADRATATKTRFLAAASHDLRQPLQSLGLYLTVLSRQLSDSRAQDIAGKMRQSLASMGEILDALLDISTLDSGSVVAECKTFALQEMLDQIATHNIPHADEKGLALRIEPTKFTVKSDPTLLQRIVENFVGNALRYTEAGEISIACKKAGESVHVEVSDTGVGIPPEALETIFEEYFQLENPIRDRSKGLGLGLAIVRHIALLLDHELDVQSVPGQGSTFSVTLPLVGSVEERAPVGNQAAAYRDAHATAKILIVDDDPAVIDATRILLQIEGFDVQAATDGNEAVAQVESGLRPNVVVSDYRLPGMNGVEVIRRIRNLTGEELPTILVTGDTSAKEIAVANLKHCTVLHKPVDSERLISLINESCA